jgi:hypothetical protein
MNVFTFEALAGDEVEIAMRSTAFDPYLILIDPIGNVVTQQDDIFPADTDVNAANNGAYIHRVLLLDGTYTIEATTAVAGATGTCGVRMFCSCAALTNSFVGDPETYATSVEGLPWYQNPIGPGNQNFTASGGSVSMSCDGDDPPDNSFSDLFTVLVCDCNPYTVTIDTSWTSGTYVDITVVPVGVTPPFAWPDKLYLVHYPEDGLGNSRVITFTCAPNPSNAACVQGYEIRFYMVASFGQGVRTLTATITPNTPPGGEFP